MLWSELNEAVRGYVAFSCASSDAKAIKEEVLGTRRTQYKRWTNYPLASQRLYHKSNNRVQLT